MNKEQAAHWITLLQGVVDGKQLQDRGSGWEDVPDTRFLFPDAELFRLKPEARAWHYALLREEHGGVSISGLFDCMPDDQVMREDYPGTTVIEWRAFVEHPEATEATAPNDQVKMWTYALIRYKYGRVAATRFYAYSEKPDDREILRMYDCGSIICWRTYQDTSP